VIGKAKQANNERSQVWMLAN